MWTMCLRSPSVHITLIIRPSSYTLRAHSTLLTVQALLRAHHISSSIILQLNFNGLHNIDTIGVYTLHPNLTRP